MFKPSTKIQSKLYRFNSLLLSILIILSVFSVNTFASNSTTIKEIKSNEDRSSVTISITASANNEIDVYKVVSDKTTCVKTFKSDGSPIEIDLSFAEIPCFEIESVTIYTVNQAGEKSNSISFNARGKHIGSDWQIVKESSCDKEGIAEIKCKNCNKTLQTKSLSSYGHSWGNPTWSWSENYKTCTATFTCKHDSSHKQTATDSAPELNKSTPATCKDAGSNTYTASVTFNGKSYSTSKTVTLNRTSHILSDWEVLEKATCSNMGLQVKKCTKCNEIIETQELPPISHNFIITYSWSADFTECYAAAVCANDDTHIETETVKATETVEIQATCMKSGRIARKATFTNPVFEEQVRKATVTGIHTDKNSDNVCDLCRMKISSTPSSDTSTTDRNAFNDGSEPITDSSGQSLVFDEETTTQPNSIENHSEPESESAPDKEKPITRKIIVVAIIMSVCIVGATICTIALVKVIKNKPEGTNIYEDEDADLYE